MPSWLKIASYLLLASLATLGFKKPTLLWVFNLNDLFLMASFVFFLIAIFKKEIILAIPRKIAWGFFIALASMVVGTLISIIFFHAVAPIAAREYGRIIADLIICLELYVIATHHQLFTKQALVAIAIPSVLLPFLMYVPHSWLLFLLDESQSRFSGFLFDPNYFASFQILPTFILAWIAYQQPFGKKLWLSAIAFLLFVVSVGSIVWSGSRGGIIGLLIAMIFLIFFLVKKNPLLKAFFLTALLIIGCSASFFILPKKGQEGVQIRKEQIVQLDAPRPVLHLVAHQNRFSIWESSLREILRSPLGYGPGYHQTANLHGDEEDYHRVAHNSVLQIILTGGIVLLVVVGVGLIYFIRKLPLLSVSLGEVHYLVSALIGIVAAGLLLDSLFSRWLWVCLALIFALIYYRSSGSTSRS